jgi:two-component system chemotaxis response regulator CheB
MSSPRREPVIVLVSSAGGLDAIGRVLAGLPPDLPAGVIALQHHDPTHTSGLAMLLARASRLPVADVRDGEPIRPGRVFVAPSGFHTLIAADRTLVLLRSGQRPPLRPSADLLLASLAIAVRTDAIAVVLSGYGHDGAAGATAVKRMGGTLVASDRASSQQFGMPEAAIDTGDVDHVLPLDAIGATLAQLALSIATSTS